LLIAEVCGHYVYNNKAVSNAYSLLLKNLDFDVEKFVVNGVRKSIEKYMCYFNLLRE